MELRKVRHGGREVGKGSFRVLAGEVRNEGCRVACKSIHPLPIMPHLDELCTNNFSTLTFLFITEEIKLNTAIVEGGYMSGIPAKNMLLHQWPKHLKYARNWTRFV